MTSRVIAPGRVTADNRTRGAQQQRKERLVQWYAVAIVRDIEMGPPIQQYLERIDATLAPFGGHFIVHGGKTKCSKESLPAP
jgi:Domain of unknown function (DUF1330)